MQKILWCEICDTERSLSKTKVVETGQPEVFVCSLKRQELTPLKDNNPKQ